MGWRHFLAGLTLLGMASGPAWANFLVELSFERKMAESDIVIVGTVTSAAPGSATVRVLSALKGTPGPEVRVSTTSRIAEADPNCCNDGATYVMFLHRYRELYHSVNGAYGMVRIGSQSGGHVEVIPASRF